MGQGIVAADAEDQVAGVGRQSLDLASDIIDAGSVYGQQGCRPRCRHQRAKLGNDVRPARGVGAVIED
jgi:hypothetical protein